MREREREGERKGGRDLSMFLYSRTSLTTVWYSPSPHALACLPTLAYIMYMYMHVYKPW